MTSKSEIEEMLIISKLSAVPLIFTLMSGRGTTREYLLSMHNNTLFYRQFGTPFIQSAYDVDAVITFILTGERLENTTSIVSIKNLHFYEYFDE